MVERVVREIFRDAVRRSGGAVLSPSQYGDTENRGCADLMAALTGYIAKERQAGRTVAVLNLDLRSAFERVPVGRAGS